MSISAYGSITVTDLLDTATYIYYSATNSSTLTDWHTTPQSTDKYIGIYDGPPSESGQPANPTQSIYNAMDISKYVGDDGVSVYVQGTSRTGNVTTITMTDGTTIEITDGTDGSNGTNGRNGYVHIAWANSADGTTDFSNINSSDKMYIGIYTDDNYADSQNPSAYNWSLIKGDKGDKGEQGDQGAQGVGILSVENQYYSSTSAETPTGGEWSSAVPLYDENKFLWVRMKVEYDDGTIKYTNPVHDTELDTAFQKLSSVEGDVSGFEATVNGINQQITNYNNILNGIDDRVTGAETTLGDQSDWLQELQNTLNEEIARVPTVTINGEEMTVDNYLHLIADFIAANQSVATDLATTTNNLNSLLNQFNNYIKDENQYMRFSDEKGLEIGAEDSNFKTVIDNQRIAFEDNGQIAAYISGQIFYINNAFIKGTLRKANDSDKPGYEEQIQTDGSIRIVWVGGV